VPSAVFIEMTAIGPARCYDRSMEREPVDSSSEKRKRPPRAVVIIVRLLVLPVYLVFRLIRAGLWTTLAIVWSAFSVYLSVKRGNCEWFARSGAIVALAGAWLSGRTIWRASRAARRDPKWSGIPVVFESGIVIDSKPDGSVTFRLDDESKQRRVENRREAMAAGTGVTLAVVGTLIWGYGDWLLAWLLAIRRG
jgi:hypothetical protein